MIVAKSLEFGVVKNNLVKQGMQCVQHGLVNIVNMLYDFWKNYQSMLNKQNRNYARLSQSKHNSIAFYV